MSDLLRHARLDQPRRRRQRLPRIDADIVGLLAERVARFLGTGRFLLFQTILVVVWIALNVFAIKLQWDPYPFILLNLAFSTQAAYAAPLILLAQTRQADRDKAIAVANAHHSEELAQRHTELLEANTKLTKQVERLTEQIHAATVGGVR